MKRILFAAVLAIIIHGVLLTIEIHRTSQTPPTVRQRTVQITLAAATPATRAGKEKKTEKRFTVSDPVPMAKKMMTAKRAKRVGRNRELAKKKIIMKRISAPILKRPVGKPIDKKGPPKQSKITEAVPAYRKNPPPRYPRMARRRGCEGTVLIKVLVTREGKVKEANVGQSSGYGVLDRSALKAVKGWLFVPGMKGDQAVEMWVTVPIRFALK